MSFKLYISIQFNVQVLGTRDQESKLQKYRESTTNLVTHVLLQIVSTIFLYEDIRATISCAQSWG